MGIASAMQRLMRPHQPDVLAHLPARIILLRHAKSQDLDSAQAEGMPNHGIPLHPEGEAEALAAGKQLTQFLHSTNQKWRVHLFCSPYKRARQTAALMFKHLPASRIAGYQEEVLLREQDYGNFVTSAEQLAAAKEERLRFGRFWYRFPNGESGADVLTRMTIFQDHLVRDMVAGRFEARDSVVLVGHGLTLRMFLMRWLHWKVDQFLGVFNPPGAQPLVLEKQPHPSGVTNGRHRQAWSQAPFIPAATKSLYVMTPETRVLLPGVSEDMMSTSNDWALSKMGVDSHIRPAQRNKQWSSTLACDSEQHKCNNNVALKPASEDKQAAVVSPHLVSPSNKDKQQH